MAGTGAEGLLASLLCLLLVACAAPSYREPAVDIADAHGGGSELAFNPGASLLASGGWSGYLRLWQVQDGEEYRSWRAHQGEITGLFFVDGGESLLTSSLDGRLALWDLHGRLRKQAMAPSPIAAAAVEERTGVILTGHWDGTIRTWNLFDLAPIDQQSVHQGRVRAVASHATGWFASSGEDGQVYSMRRGEAPRRLEPPATDARTLTFYPDGRWLYAAGWFDLSSWDMETGVRQVLQTEHRGLINSIWFTADGSSLASVSKQTDSAVLFLDPNTGATLRRFQSHDLCGTSVRTSQDGRVVASSAADGSIRIWMTPVGSSQPQR